MSHLERLHRDNGLWLALPREVSRWWRQRDQMVLTRKGGSWSIEGEGSERARVAFAILQGEELVYSFADKPETGVAVTSRSPLGTRA
jgi:hypothetical protein